MADHNTYLAYKRDTRQLLYWIVQATNSIIKSIKTSGSLGNTSMEVNTTGEISISALLPLSELIAKHINPIPATIFYLFQSIITARKEAHTFFQQMVINKPDPEIEKSNDSHKFAIDAFTEAFKALGGDDWASSSRFTSNKSEQEDVEDVIFRNKFTVLNVGEQADGLVDGGDDETDNDEVDEGVLTSKHLQGKKQTKRNKGKKGRSKKGKKPIPRSHPTTKDGNLEDVPWENYRLIGDMVELDIEYFLAVFYTAKEWAELRTFVQSFWHDVAYNGLNSAVAAALLNVANAMVKQAESAMFVEFPGRESYEAIINTLACGNLENAQGRFCVIPPKGTSKGYSIGMGNKGIQFDFREQFMIYAHQDLLDFIIDYQKTRTGKPTKSMLSQIKNWNPDMDLREMSKEDRIKWRRVYTIKWLYDLVNLYVSPVIQEIVTEGQKLVLENVDWSHKAPLQQYRKLFGLNEFAGSIAALAMQKQGTNIRPRILPHHVFQLQCIVDSMTNSKGWFISAFMGHVVVEPPQDFLPRRDIDLFLDLDYKRRGHGIDQTIETLLLLLEEKEKINGDQNRYPISGALKLLLRDFNDWLGKSRGFQGPTKMPPSQFSATNSNGLWDYSPYLCAAGLLEALDLSYDFGLLVWEQSAEPMLIIHLHNMLVQKGYIEAMGLWGSLQWLFPTSFFVDGKIPTSNFKEALGAILGTAQTRRAESERRQSRRTARRTWGDIHDLIQQDINGFFKQKSLIGLLHAANCRPDQISDADVPSAARCMARVAEMTQLTGAQTGDTVLKDNTHENRARSKFSNNSTAGLASGTAARKDDLDKCAKEVLPDGHKPLPEPSLEHGIHTKRNYTVRELLSTLEYDLVDDICGWKPRSALNYFGVTVAMLSTFKHIEAELERRRNPLWVKACNLPMPGRRTLLVVDALAGEDEECLEVIAHELQRSSFCVPDFIYWKELDVKERKYGHDLWAKLGGSGCTVM